MKKTTFTVQQTGEYNDPAISKALQSAQNKIKSLGIAEYDRVDLTLVTGNTQVTVTCSQVEESE